MTLALSMEGVLSFGMVAIGLGFVIFFHELGHFAVAKWCDVEVERFSIGFGPIIWSRTWGETEYALSAIPFGGYVKMVGQDDLDPGQETNEDVADNPRSYTAKSVPQRMAIISAGVIMNVITGFLFFTGAMWLGTQVPANIVGNVAPGMPAWIAGLREDDVIEQINNRKVADFDDVTRGTALSTGRIRVTGHHYGGEPFDLLITPEMTNGRRFIGVGPQYSLALRAIPEGKDYPVARPGSPAAEAGGFQPGDEIRQVGDTPLKDFAQLRAILAEKKSEPLDLYVASAQNTKETENQQNALRKISIGPQRYRSIGIRVDIGKIKAVQQDSPADRAGIKPGDRMTTVDGLDIGTEIDPARLPDYFVEKAGQKVEVRLTRSGKGSREITVTLVPEARHLWTRRFSTPNTPMPIPAIGVAFEFVPRILAVDEGSAAEAEGVKRLAVVKKVTFKRPDDWPADHWDKQDIVLDLADEKKQAGWTHVIMTMQLRPTWPIELTIAPSGEKELRTVTLQSKPVEDWYVVSDRGLELMPLFRKLKAHSLGEAFAMGGREVRDAGSDIYLTLRNLFSGDLSPKQLHGPIGIFSIGVEVAQSGLARFLIFLGFLSINLAVLNFLPIPVLDGGHMVFLIWEGIARKRPSERVYATAMYLGMAFVLGLMLFVIFLDLMRAWT